MHEYAKDLQVSCASRVHFFDLASTSFCSHGVISGPISCLRSMLPAQGSKPMLQHDRHLFSCYMLARPFSNKHQVLLTSSDASTRLRPSSRTMTSQSSLNHHQSTSSTSKFSAKAAAPASYIHTVPIAVAPVGRSPFDPCQPPKSGCLQVASFACNQWIRVQFQPCPPHLRS